MFSASLSVAPAPPSWLCECVISLLPTVPLTSLVQLCSFQPLYFHHVGIPQILLAPLNLFFPVLQAFG